MLQAQNHQKNGASSKHDISPLKTPPTTQGEIAQTSDSDDVYESPVTRSRNCIPQKPDRNLGMSRSSGEKSAKVSATLRKKATSKLCSKKSTSSPSSDLTRDSDKEVQEPPSKRLRFKMNISFTHQ
jgi:hypothetical protein